MYFILFFKIRNFSNKPKFNPSGMPVITVEFQHKIQSILEIGGVGMNTLRGGTSTADHVGKWNVLKL